MERKHLPRFLECAIEIHKHSKGISLFSGSEGHLPLRAPHPFRRFHSCRESAAKPITSTQLVTIEIRICFRARPRAAGATRCPGRTTRNYVLAYIIHRRPSEKTKKRAHTARSARNCTLSQKREAGGGPGLTGAWAFFGP